MPFFLLFPILVIAAVACLIAAVLAVVFLSVLGVAFLLTAIVLHKLGLDRVLIAHLTRSRRAPKGFKARVDDLDVPITAVWTIDESSSERRNRS